jgi:hypothetical protein
MIRTPRGIAPELLVSQVRNTMPYLFEGDDPPPAALPPVETTEPVPSTLSPSLEGR